MLKTYLSLTAIVLCTSFCLSQDLIKSLVVDGQNISVYNAHAYFTGIPIGVITDEKGHFELESDHTFKNFEVSFVGMQTVKMNIVPNKAFYKISLVEDSALQELVVVSNPKKLKKKENTARYSLNEKNTFTLLNYYDYITDQYLNAYFEHHFNGFVMNSL